MASQCPLLERTNIVPFRNKFQFVCNSPGFNSTCNDRLEEFCVNDLRTYKNCEYFIVTED